MKTESTDSLVIREAYPTDNDALRELTEVPMPGVFRVAYRQSPDFFAGETIRGDEARVGVLTNATNKVLGCGSRVVRRAWFHGAYRRTGYYCTLRAFPEGRNGRAILVAYRWARKVEQTDPLAVITSTIISANTRVIRLLTSRHAGLPAYLDAGVIVSFTAAAKALKRHVPNNVYEILDGEAAGEIAVRAFYAAAADTPPLFPELPVNLPAGLTWRDFIVLRKNGRIVAAAAVWNQSATRQIRVVGYHPLLGAVRPLANLFLRCVRLPLLPSAGTDLPFRYLAFRKVSAAEPNAFRVLLAAAATRLAPNESLSFSLHECDPLQAEMTTVRAIRYASRLYTLSYEANPQPVDWGGVPYIEAAML